jgi:quinol monooxygenase YgiN
MTMAIGLLATITVQQGKNAEFEQIFLSLTEQVRANEPGNIFYALHRSKADPQVYKVMEQYDSPEALDAHGKADYFREANKALGALVAAPPEIEILDAVHR